MDTNATATADADREMDALDASPALPRLESGVTVLERPDRGTGLHRLALATLADRAGTALWVDARGDASTYLLYDLADERTLRGLRVARAFTAYQHVAVVRAAARAADARTALLVAPAVASLYRDDDVPGREGERLLDATLTTLAGLADVLEVPALVSVRADAADALADRVRDAADATLAVRDTRLGTVVEGEAFAPRGYHRRGYWQTTVPYWVDLFGAVDDDRRHSPAPAVPEVDA
ncbi:MAG: hypothetical protein ABEJ70_00465 [Halobacteriaceae archaeon]